MSCPIGAEELGKLRAFIGICSAKPEILNIPQLEFFKAFVEKLGGKIPAGEFKMPSAGESRPVPEEKPSPEEPKPESEEEPESDIELDMSGVIEGDTDDPQPMGDAEKVPTEEEIDEASGFRSKAAAAFSEQKYQEAIELYTKAIELNPGSALFHAKRGQAYLKLQKPNACIRDCDKALELNCDSAAAYKYRGRAHRLLGNFENAAKDLRQACKIDFDEEADEWLREVTPNAKKIEQHRIKQERKRAEKELRRRQEQAKNRAKARPQEQQPSADSSAGAGPGEMPNLKNMFADESIREALKDPEVAAAMQEIMMNPANITKHMQNPKLMNFMKKVVGGGTGGESPFPGGFPGAEGFPGFGQSTDGASTDSASAPKTNTKPDFSDEGLD